MRTLKIVGFLFVSLLTLNAVAQDAAVVRYFQLGSEYLKVKQYKQAIVEFKRAIVLEPKRPEFLANLGMAYLGDGQVTRAEETLKEAQKLDPAPPSVGR